MCDHWIWEAAWVLIFTADILRYLDACDSITILELQKCKNPVCFELVYVIQILIFVFFYFLDLP